MSVTKWKVSNHCCDEHRFHSVGGFHCLLLPELAPSTPLRNRRALAVPTAGGWSPSWQRRISSTRGCHLTDLVLLLSDEQLGGRLSPFISLSRCRCRSVRRGEKRIAAPGGKVRGSPYASKERGGSRGRGAEGRSGGRGCKNGADGPNDRAVQQCSQTSNTDRCGL